MERGRLSCPVTVTVGGRPALRFRRRYIPRPKKAGGSKSNMSRPFPSTAHAQSAARCSRPWLPGCARMRFGGSAATPPAVHLGLPRARLQAHLKARGFASAAAMANASMAATIFSWRCSRRCSSSRCSRRSSRRHRKPWPPYLNHHRARREAPPEDAAEASNTF